MEPSTKTELADLLLDHYPAMIGRARSILASRADAEDVVQDVAERLLTAPHLLAGVERFGGWLLTVITRRCVDLIRRDRRAQDYKKARAQEEPEPQEDESPFALVEDEEQARALARAVNELSPDLRFALVENELEGKTFRQIAAETGIPAGTLMARKYRAVAEVRRRLIGEADPVA